MSLDLLTSPQEYFSQLVEEGLSDRKIKTYPLVSNYLSDLLLTYVFTENLYRKDEEGRLALGTLAEQFFEANLASTPQKQDLLKKLGDTSLYISGFFGDSLKRKVVDIDYYVDIGGAAYSTLSKHVGEELQVRVYEEISARFLEFVDVFTFISQKAMVQTNSDILRLYDRYLSTGSELAKDQLAKMGLLNEQVQKKNRQQ